MPKSEKLDRDIAKMRAAGYITAKEAAEKAGVAVQTVYRWMDAGHIEGRIIRPWYRFVLVTSLEDFLTPREAEHPAKAAP